MTKEQLNLLKRKVINGEICYIDLITNQREKIRIHPKKVNMGILNYVFRLLENGAIEYDGHYENPYTYYARV